MNYFYTKTRDAKEFLSNMKYKIENNIALLDNEAIDLIIAPDMEHDFDIKELLEDTSNLLVNAIIDDDEFHRDLTVKGKC